MGVQVTISASQIDKQRLGYQAISLTHFADLLEPSIAAGSKVEIGGALYEFTADEAGTGWASIGDSTWAYILLTPSGATVSWSYTEVAPTWDTAKQGWYTGSNRVVGGLYRDAYSQYTAKWLCAGWNDSTVSTSQIRDLAVTKAKLASEAVTANKVKWEISEEEYNTKATGQYWYPIAGLHIWVSDVAKWQLEIQWSSVWKVAGSALLSGGCILSDGTNVRLKNTDAGNASYWDMILKP